MTEKNGNIRFKTNFKLINVILTKNELNLHLTVKITLSI